MDPLEDNAVRLSINRCNVVDTSIPWKIML